MVATAATAEDYILGRLGEKALVTVGDRGGGEVSQAGQPVGITEIWGQMGGLLTTVLQELGAKVFAAGGFGGRLLEEGMT